MRLLSLSAAVLFALHLSAQTFPYQDPNLPADVRAKDLASRLTLNEKTQLMRFNSPAIPRLGIKTYNWWSEALHGVARAGVATVFPQAIGMAASWDDKLLLDVFTAVSDEARAKNTLAAKSGELKIYQGLTFWTPNINIFRDPRWGRGQETYGEDPYLTARMGINVVHGLQGPADSRYNKLHACAKHFAVHSGPEWNRHQFNAEDIAPRDLWETYLPAFKDVVQKGGVKEVMCAYNRYEGEPCCGSNRLLQQILRNEWGYKGIVVSDCWAVADFFVPGRHDVDPDAAHASSRAVRAGTDLECGSAYADLEEGVKKGLIDEQKINQSVERVLQARFELGEMDNNVEWQRIPYSVVDSKEHRALALKMAQEGIVLLQNRDNLLPLNKQMKIAVIGPNANDSVMQWGNYNGFPSQTSTLLGAMQSRMPGIVYDAACDHTATTALKSLFDKCSSKGEQGFTATYWNNMELKGDSSATDRIHTAFHFTTAGATAFAPGIRRSFSAVYETTFRPETDMDAIFTIQVMGKADLYINGEPVANALNMKTNRLYTLNAKAGQSYDLKLIFYATEGDCATLNFDFGREVPLDIDATVKRVADADVVVFAGGISPQLEGEEMPVKIEGFHGGDRDSISLPAIQRQLLTALHKAGKRIVLVNYSGSAITLPREAELCDAIVQAWYPGEEGGEAVASMLMGEYNPAGRLPITFYKDISQLPPFEEYSMKGRTYRYLTTEPLFPFGHGLSYTTFAYGKAKASSKSIKTGDEVTITIPVTNTGERDGEEVVQLYLSRPGDKEGPTHALRGFQRVPLAKGETKAVSLTLNPDDLQWFDTNTNTMRVIPGEYMLSYGGTSDLSKLQSLKLKIKK